MRVSSLACGVLFVSTVAVAAAQSGINKTSVPGQTSDVGWGDFSLMR